MVYLFVGIDDVSKERKIRSLKQETFKDKDSSFDFESVYADDIDRPALTDALNRLPLQAPQRLVVIRQIEKLSVVNREVVLAFLKQAHKHLVLILDTALPDIKKNQFVSEVARKARLVQFMKARTVSVFDVADALADKNAAVALKNFSRLVASGEQPQKLLGGLFWKWNQLRPRLKRESFIKGLTLFRQTDTDIKLSKKKPVLALELLIVRLCELAAG